MSFPRICFHFIITEFVELVKIGKIVKEERKKDARKVKGKLCVRIRAELLRLKIEARGTV